MAVEASSRYHLNRKHGLRLLHSVLYACLLAQMGALPLCAQAEAGGVITGRVTDVRGQPQQTLVHLFAEGEIPAGDVYTDSNGLFAFNALPNGTYYVLVEVRGYRPVRQPVKLDSQLYPKAQVNVALELSNQQPKSSNPTIAGSRSSYQLNVKKLTRPFDPKARREFDKGNKAQQQGNFAAALAHYGKALRVEPDFYPALNNLGAILLRQKKPAEAEAAFLRSVEINPDDGQAYINLGHLLYEQAKYPEAIDRLEEGLKRSPGSAVGHFLLGSAYLKMGDLGKAESRLRTAYNLDPVGMASARLQLANLYLRRHDIEAASAELESYVQANPSDPRIPAIKKALANIKAHRASNASVD
jgi:tetratricopeptide (TPR) repeat protein